jgi:hypothetical protein
LLNNFPAFGNHALTWPRSILVYEKQRQLQTGLVAAWLLFPQQKDNYYEENIMDRRGGIAPGGRGICLGVSIRAKGRGGVGAAGGLGRHRPT